jgi:hypothetical protein
VRWVRGNIGILVFEVVVTGLVVWAGLCKKRILFIDGPRSAAITLGIVGLLLCVISVGKFVSAAPAHPLTIVGYVLGVVALLAFLTQIFSWGIPFLSDPRVALFVLAGCIVVKGVIARIGWMKLE